MGMTFIAEIGLNHNGNPGLIFELVKQASLAGADIAKFQLGWRAKPGEINALGWEEINLILECCAFHDVSPMFSVFNREALALLDDFSIDHYKIASRTLVDEPELTRDILARGKTTYVSLGMWEGGDKPFEQADHLKFLWCKAKYPSYPWDLADLPKNFQESGFHGYSDHSVGLEVPIIAINRGARIVEKHFTLDKSDTTIRDHALSATPDEFRTLVELGRGIVRCLEHGV